MLEKVLLCAPRPKTDVTGLTLAFELLIKGMGESGIRHSIVDAAFIGSVSKSGKFSVGRALETLVVVFRVWWHLLRCDVYYATMSTSSVGFWRDYLTVAVASILNRRIVLHLHGGGFEQFFNSQGAWMRRRIVKTLNSVTRIVVLGELLKDQFRCAGASIYAKLVVVPNGLTLGVQEPDLVDKRLPEVGGEINLLYMSSLIPSKGFLDVIDAVALLGQLPDGRPLHLHLCGTFVGVATEVDCAVCDQNSLRNYLIRNNLCDKVTFHGQVTGAEKERQFRKAHIFLLPTYYPWEGQPLSIIEALAYAVPVISTYHKGIPEEVIDGFNGVLIKPKSPVDVAEAIVRLAESPDQYHSYSQSARSHYVSNFRRSVHLGRLISVIMGCEEDALPAFRNN